MAPETPSPEAAALLDDRAAASALALLADGVPLTLLLDLAAAVPSRDIYREEVADTAWLRIA